MNNLSIAQIISRLENYSIQTYQYKEGKKICGYELNTYTDGGVNQIVFIDFRDTGKDPKNGKDFIELYNKRVQDIDISEEVESNRQDKSYVANFSIEESVRDFKEWKETLLNIFNDKTPQQRQFEQVTDKLRSQLAAMEETLKMMPTKGNTTETCQRTAIQIVLNELDSHINGIELSDFTPNEHSQDFKLSYS